jgi:hypothetical protein
MISKVCIEKNVQMFWTEFGDGKTQDSRWLNWYSKRAPLEYKSEALPLEIPRSVAYFELNCDYKNSVIVN